MLRKLFQPFDQIAEINIVRNPGNNKPLGYAFVQLGSKVGTIKAISALNGTLYKGRKIEVGYSVD